MGAGTDYTALSCYQLCLARLEAAWPGFLARRQERLKQRERFGQAAEKVAEEILTDCLTRVLDWPLGSINYQVEHADFVLTTLGVKRLVIEAKRPGALQWNRAAVDRALAQARRYAAEQRITRAAVCDGAMLYAEDLDQAEPRPRIFCELSAPAAPEDLWWLSQEGIYRSHQGNSVALPAEPPSGNLPVPATGSLSELRDRKYGLPARCFAYAPDPSRPATWKLPYRRADGAVDAARLPKAIQCILTNYRGARVSGIPEAKIPGVLRILEQAARSGGHMPDQNPSAAAAYRELAEAIGQISRPGAGAAR